MPVVPQRICVCVPCQAREYPEAEKTLRLAAHLLIKAVLQYLPVLVPQPDFGDCWQRVLQVLQVLPPCMCCLTHKATKTAA